MKAGFNKGDASNFFLYFSLPLIIVFVLIFVAWYLIFQVLNHVFSFEKINIFLECEKVNIDIGEDLYDYLHEISSEDYKVKELNIYAYSSSDSSIGEYYQAFGTNADILILSRQDLIDTDEYIDDNFLEFSSDLKSYLPVLSNDFNFEYFDYNGKSYALKIYDSKDEEYSSQLGFNTWLEFETDEQGEKIDEEYYLLINLYSDNIYPVIETSYSSNAFLTLNYIFNRFSFIGGSV